MTTPVLITGGTGNLGRSLVPRLRAAVDGEIRLLSRRAPEGGSTEDGIVRVRGDLSTGAGIEAAVQGVATILHCASSAKGDAEATERLVRAAEAQKQPPHLVFVSIVGVDKLSFGYFKAKYAAEQVVTGSALPWTVLRATQFYDLILDGAKKAGKLPVVPVPRGFVVQPVDPDHVAARLVELAQQPPAGRVDDLAGPEVSDAAALIRSYLDRTGRTRRPLLQLPMPGTRAVRDGALLPGADRPVTAGGRSFAQYLETKLG